MANIFNELLYRPFLNILVFFYERLTFADLGIAIILLTILIRVVLFPFFFKVAKHQKITQGLQPKIKELQERHKDDKNAQAKAVMDLYKEHGINPFTPLLMLAIQIPILIALYQVFMGGFSEEALKSLYSFMPRPEVINNTFLGLSLAVPNLVIAVLAAITQYVQGRLSMATMPKDGSEDPAAKMGRQMMYFLPGITLVILWSLPAAIGLYWLTGNAFSIFQQMLVNRHMEKYHGLGSKQGVSTVK